LKATYHDQDAIIYVIDAADEERIEESGFELSELLVLPMPSLASLDSQTSQPYQPQQRIAVIS
jgi:hypothetical protein